MKIIIVPTDFSEYSAAALRYAIPLAEMNSSELHVLHVITEEGHFHRHTSEGKTKVTELKRLAEREMKTWIDRNLQKYARVHHVILSGVPYKETIRYGKTHNADLIVMATHGRTGLARVLLGSVAEKIVRLSPVPVLTIKPDAIADAIITETDVEQELHISIY